MGTLLALTGQLLEAMPLVNHYHTDGSRPVSLLPYKHGTKVAKISLASLKSPNKNMQVAENQYVRNKLAIPEVREITIKIRKSAENYKV